MSRGALNWLITIPAGGALIAGGVIPMLIEWRVDEHPAIGLEDKGCALKRLDLFHSDARAVRESLECLALRGEVAFHRLPIGEGPTLWRLSKRLEDCCRSAMSIASNGLARSTLAPP
jgi:Glyoxalase-like domain